MNFIYVQILVTSDRKLVNFSIIATFLNRFRRVAFLVHSTPSDIRCEGLIYLFMMWHIPLRCKWYILFRYSWYIPLRFGWFFHSATGGSDRPLYPQYAICGHLCACGCGERVITPLSPTQWKLVYNGETVILYPSIGNYAFACQSHYFLTNGKIVWVCERDGENCKRKKKGLMVVLLLCRPARL